MREIVIISGKGGTGKTSVCAAFAHLLKNGVICDLDVDAPDLHIILEPDTRETHDFLSGNTAVIRQDTCVSCDLCLEKCRFGAVREEKGRFLVDGSRCEGCGVCVDLCPARAVDFPERHCGHWFRSDSRFGPFIHAQLGPGEENSGRLVTLLKQQAREHAREHGLETILCDGSPGIGCPVISSLSGATLAVAVVEPTPSGRHDFIRVADLCDHFRVPVAVVLNKADLNENESDALKTFCAERGYTIAGALPFSPDVTAAMVRRQAVTESASALAAELERIWRGVLDLAVPARPIQRLS